MNVYKLPKSEIKTSEYAFFCTITISKKLMNRYQFNQSVKRIKKITAFLDSVIGRTLYFSFYHYVPETKEEIKKAKELNYNFGKRFLEQVKKESESLNKNLIK